MGLKYALGLLDNTTTVSGIKTITTPGSYNILYVAGNIEIKGMRKIVDFFGTSERRSRLDTHALAHNWIYYMTKLDGDTRVSLCHTIIQKMLFSYQLLNHFFEHSASGAEKVVFTNMSVNDWDLLEDMEAVVDPLSVTPCTSSQMEQFVTASYFFLRKRNFYKNLKN